MCPFGTAGVQLLRGWGGGGGGGGGCLGGGGGGGGGGGRSPAALFCNLKKSDLTLEKNMLKLCSSMG